ncbi:MAG: hypothetical protein LBL86_00215, partial [Coriobacteriales bacterium]|nr:hypothetical protein [Coriobacteriales bacterium]
MSLFTPHCHPDMPHCHPDMPHCHPDMPHCHPDMPHCHPEPAEGSLGPSARKTHRVFSEDGPTGPRNPSARKT